VLVSGVLANVFIVGINQLVDVNIDKVNVKDLPLVTGALSWECGRKITGRSLLLAVMIAFYQSTVWGLCISCMCLIGIIYSVPPLRLKRFAVPAALCIVLARAIIGTVGGVFTYSAAMNREVDAFMRYHMSVFVGILVSFTTVIALMKDVPDIEGDRIEGVRSLSIVMGPSAVCNICLTILSTMYVTIMSLNWSSPTSTPCFFSHLYGLVWLHLATVPGSTKTSAMFNYFSVVWPLFYYEFFAYLVPIAIDQIGLKVDPNLLAFFLGIEIAFLKFHTSLSAPATSFSLAQTIRRKSGLDIVSLYSNLGLSVVPKPTTDLVSEAALEMSVALTMHSMLTKLTGRAFRDAKRLAILTGDWLLAKAVISLCETRNQETIHVMGKSIMSATDKPEIEIANTISEFAEKARSHVVSSF
jgi:homogentisate phytyltransferase/homogentisate geranylgeranyltransferase